MAPIPELPNLTGLECVLALFMPLSAALPSNRRFQAASRAVGREAKHSDCWLV